jgi:hypothetical protein
VEHSGYRGGRKRLDTERSAAQTIAEFKELVDDGGMF